MDKGRSYEVGHICLYKKLLIFSKNFHHLTHCYDPYSVGDADNFRLYHTPGPLWRFPLPLRRVPTQARGTWLIKFGFPSAPLRWMRLRVPQTWRIRRCTFVWQASMHLRSASHILISPAVLMWLLIILASLRIGKAAHFGRPAQKYADEALAWLRQRIEGKVLYCQLIHRDRYGRLVRVFSPLRRFYLAQVLYLFLIHE